LYYNYFRYYDQELGRYITSDPIGLGGGLNTYAYVGGNPLNLFDSLGLCEKSFSSATPLSIPTQVYCHLGCHGVSYGATRYANDREMLPLNAAAVAVDFALPMPPIYSISKATKGVGFTFRGDSRTPDEIFLNGFGPRGTSTDLQAHALDNTLPPSMYVSTSKSADVAVNFASNVYIIKPKNGIDVNATLGSRSPFPDCSAQNYHRTFSPIIYHKILLKLDCFTTLPS